MGTGRMQLTVNEWTLEVGGHCRTGFEDNVRFDQNRLAKNNAELVSRLAATIQATGRKVATPRQAATSWGSQSDERAGEGGARARPGRPGGRARPKVIRP